MIELAAGSDVFWALALTILAGLSTAIGAAIDYFIKKPRMSYLSFSLGFSAGVMIYVSFMEMMPSAIAAVGEVAAPIAFFGGMLFIGLIDFIVPEHENPHYHIKQAPSIAMKKSLMRMGLFMALGIGIHNFPEGLATFATSLSSIKLGAVVALAIAIHNIPEGIAVSTPIYYATGSKRKAFLYSSASGLAEPIGAIVGFLILMPFLSPWLIASLLAFVAGIMVYISLDKILPAANNYGQSHILVLGIGLGMLVMAVSIVIFRIL